MKLKKLLKNSMVCRGIELTVYAGSDWAENNNTECKYYHIKNGLEYAKEILKTASTEEYKKIMESKVEFFYTDSDGTFEICTYTL